MGIPDNIARYFKGMNEVFDHLIMRRATIGELLRTLRVMGRHDVVNLLSASILDKFTENANPESVDGLSSDDGYKFSCQEDDQLSPEENCGVSIPIQESLGQ